MTTMTLAAGIEGRFMAEEHRRLRLGQAALQQTLTEAHRLPRPELVDRVHRTIEWLRRDVLPHAAWEDGWLFPELDKTAGTGWATRVLRFAHTQIVEEAARLDVDAQVLREHWSIEVAFRIVARLARLDALISTHVAQEERFAVPLLARDPALV